jgi:micrococcal nuclease
MGIIRFVGGHKLLSTLAVGAAVVIGGSAAVTATAAETATVTKIVDGDTIDVVRVGAEVRVRLLNVDTPESVDPDEPVQCLGPESTEFLAALLPLGTEVRLRHDVERIDGYGRELAGVFADGMLINAEIARAGYGTAVVYGENDRYYDEVLAAQEEAKANAAGLYATDLACTLPAKVEQLTAAAGESAPASTGLEALDAYGAELAATAATAAALIQTLDGDSSLFPLAAFTAAELTSLRSSASTAAEKVATAQNQNATKRAAEQQRLDDERRAQEEAARKAAEEAARKAAEEAARQAAVEEAARQAAAEAEARKAAEAEAARRAEERRSAQTSAPTAPRSSGGTSGSSGGSSSGGYDGYTGCRAYGGGYAPNAIDEKGRPYTKIDCTTKQPI